MTQTITEGNKIIAVFMGYTNEPEGVLNRVPNVLTHSDKLTLHAEYYEDDYHPKYHSSWDWLMAVVEKISLIPFPKDKGWKDEDYKDFSAYPYPRTFGMRNTEGKFMVRLNANSLFEADTLIEATWLAVVEYITWYNTLPSKGE